MLDRIVRAEGLIIFVSPLLRSLGLPHAFSSRLGGVSSPPYDTLNLGQPTGLIPDEELDDLRHVHENTRRLNAAIGCSHHRVVRLRQVHGCQVFLPGAQLPSVAPPADAVATDQPDQLLMIRTADCVPILFGDRKGRAVAAVHAGWRGIVTGVISATVRSMAQQFRVFPSELVAAIGPCICGGCYEVGPEVAGRFCVAGCQDAVIQIPNRREHADLSVAAALQLRHAGLHDQSIDRTNRCTCCDQEEFFSHRRDGPRTGRLAGVIAISETSDRAPL